VACAEATVTSVSFEAQGREERLQGHAQQGVAHAADNDRLAVVHGFEDSLDVWCALWSDEQKLV
jgi:hypothetical protein